MTENLKKDIICFICSLSSGGAEHQIAELSNLLVQEGYNVRLVTFGDMPDHYKLDNCVERIRLAEGRHKMIKLLRIFLFFLFCKTDCIFCYGQRESLLCLIPSMFRLKRSRVVACERSCTINRSPYSFEKYLYNWFYKFAFAIVCNSYTQRDYISRIKPKYAHKTFTIINYVDLERFTSSSKIHNNPPIIGIFARYIKLKNYERLVEVVTRLKEKGYRFRLEWYGNIHTGGNKINPEYEFLQDRIKKLNIEDYFLLFDHISSVPLQISKCDAICIASLWEGFSNSVAEGISSGKPMLVSDVSDNGVMVRNETNGFLFNPLDVEDITKAFERLLLMTKEERECMGVKSRNIAESLFNKETFIASYKELIEKAN